MTDIPRTYAALPHLSRGESELVKALRPFAEIGTGEVFKKFAAQANGVLVICNAKGERLCFIDDVRFVEAHEALSRFDGGKK